MAESMIISEKVLSRDYPFLVVLSLGKKQNVNKSAIYQLLVASTWNNWVLRLRQSLDRPFWTWRMDRAPMRKSQRIGWGQKPWDLGLPQLGKQSCLKKTGLHLNRRGCSWQFQLQVVKGYILPEQKKGFSRLVGVNSTWLPTAPRRQLKPNFIFFGSLNSMFG